MTRARRLSVVTLTLLAAVGAANGGGGTGSAPVRVVDRTFSCTVQRVEGFRYVDVAAVSGFRDPPDAAEWEWQPASWVLDRSGRSLASMTAGDPPAAVQRQRVPMLAVHPTPCRPAKRISFSRRGLVGGRASQLQGSDRYACRVGRSVRLRVRAVFREPTTFARRSYRGRPLLATPPDAVVAEAQVSVQNLAGRPLVFADVLESGRTRLFTAPTCLAE
jgi:hypothetical protein